MCVPLFLPLLIEVEKLSGWSSNSKCLKLSQNFAMKIPFFGDAISEGLIHFK